MDNTSAQWPHKTPIVIDPSKRKGLAIILAIYTLGTLWLIKGNDMVDFFVTIHNEDILRPQMAQLAAQGKPDAISWMIMHDATYRTDTYFESVKKAADAGNTQSMYLYGLFLKSKKIDGEYIARAAAEGYPDAVLAQSTAAQRIAVNSTDSPITWKSPIVMAVIGFVLLVLGFFYKK